jgi:predicted  nucleic acid-binding Zn-ribbon protein
LNPKLQKVNDEIDKLKRKIADYQNRLRNLERQKTELENADIVAMVRGIDIPPSELREFARTFMEQRQTCAVPDLPAPPDNAAHETEKPAKEVSED